MSTTDDDPIARFNAALARAREKEAHDATAMTLATADARGRPSARMVLIKSADERGFVFYTNKDSRKGRELEENAFAALCFFWPRSGEQVRIEGRVEHVGDDESDAYFATRPRESQIGAWASDQSAPLASREALEARCQEIAARYPAEVPRPSRWGGYRVVPDRIEFWFNRDGRLHDRFAYEREGGAWKMTRLFP